MCVVKHVEVCLTHLLKYLHSLKLDLNGKDTLLPDVMKCLHVLCFMADPLLTVDGTSMAIIKWCQKGSTHLLDKCKKVKDSLNFNSRFKSSISSKMRKAASMRDEDFDMTDIGTAAAEKQVELSMNKDSDYENRDLHCIQTFKEILFNHMISTIKQVFPRSLFLELVKFLCQGPQYVDSVPLLPVEALLRGNSLRLGSHTLSCEMFTDCFDRLFDLTGSGEFTKDTDNCGSEDDELSSLRSTEVC